MTVRRFMGGTRCSVVAVGVSEEGIIEVGMGGGVCWNGWEVCGRGWIGKIFPRVRRGCQSLGDWDSPADVAFTYNYARIRRLVRLGLRR